MYGSVFDKTARRYSHRHTHKLPMLLKREKGHININEYMRMLRDAIKRIWWEICEGCWLKVAKTHTNTQTHFIHSMWWVGWWEKWYYLSPFDRFCDVMSYVCIWWLNEIHSHRPNDSLYAGNLFTHGFVSLMCDNASTTQT